MMLPARIEGLFAGAPAERWPGRPASAIGKQRVAETMAITPTGLADDKQADLRVHGGPEKALHHYAAEHYPHWRRELARTDLNPGGFGENIATSGITEDILCIGDILRLGTAEVQVSQGRQPCWKLNAHTGESRMALLFQETGRTGWYYRVLATGHVAPGDRITLLDRPCPDWPIHRVTQARLTRRIGRDDAIRLAELPELYTGWRQAFARMAEGRAEDDISARLNGPT